MSTETFHIGDILSVMTGTLVSPDNIAGAHRLLDHLAGESLMTHQLPRVSREAEPVLRQRYPDLAAVVIPDFDFGGGADPEMVVLGWLATVIAEHGATREVGPLRHGDHTAIDPITEFKRKHPDTPVIVVQAH